MVALVGHEVGQGREKAFLEPAPPRFPRKHISEKGLDCPADAVRAFLSSVFLGLTFLSNLGSPFDRSLARFSRCQTRTLWI